VYRGGADQGGAVGLTKLKQSRTKDQYQGAPMGPTSKIEDRFCFILIYFFRKALIKPNFFLLIFFPGARDQLGFNPGTHTTFEVYKVILTKLKLNNTFNTSFNFAK